MINISFSAYREPEPNQLFKLVITDPYVGIKDKEIISRKIFYYKQAINVPHTHVRRYLKTAA